MLLYRVFSKPQKLSVYIRQIIFEINNIGITSLPIIAIISVFMGGIITIQAAHAIDSPLVPLYAVGFTTRESIILEFSPTIVCLILNVYIQGPGLYLLVYVIYIFVIMLTGYNINIYYIN